MTITEMNGILAEMKKSLKFDDDKTIISVRQREVDPHEYRSISLKTNIKGISYKAYIDEEEIAKRCDDDKIKEIDKPVKPNHRQPFSW